MNRELRERRDYLRRIAPEAHQDETPPRDDSCSLERIAIAIEAIEEQMDGAPNLAPGVARATALLELMIEHNEQAARVLTLALKSGWGAGGRESAPLAIVPPPAPTLPRAPLADHPHDERTQIIGWLNSDEAANKLQRDLPKLTRAEAAHACGILSGLILTLERKR